MSGERMPMIWLPSGDHASQSRRTSVTRVSVSVFGVVAPGFAAATGDVAAERQRLTVGLWSTLANRASGRLGPLLEARRGDHGCLSAHARRLLLRSSKHLFDVGKEVIDLTRVESRRPTMSEVDGSVNERRDWPAVTCP